MSVDSSDVLTSERISTSQMISTADDIYSGGRRKPVLVTDNQHGSSKRSSSSSRPRPMNKKQKGRKRQPVISDDEYEDTASELESDEDYISDADTDDSLEVAAALRKTIFADDGDENVYQVKKRKPLLRILLKT